MNTTGIAAAQPQSPLERNLAKALLLLLFLACMAVLWPFVTALLWGGILAFSIWPIYRRLVPLLRGRRTLAAAVLSVAMILTVVLPFAIVSLRLADNVSELKSATQRWVENGPSAPPAWLMKVPLVGRSLTQRWNELAADKAKMAEELRRRLEPIAAFLLKAGLKLGAGLLQLALSVLLTFFLLRNGLSIAVTLTTGVKRIAGEQGGRLLELAGTTVRGVVYGILGTALAQAVLAGLGLLVAGVPGAALLAFLTFFLSAVPMGPPLILFPAAFWLFHQGSTGWGVFMLIWGVFVSTIDNFIKPWLISQGSDMPLVLILLGVLGGALAFGFIGVFIGPTLLAVGYRLIKDWFTSDSALPESHLQDGEGHAQTEQVVTCP
jgi:predicted PurR-regulated permease PerM